MQANFEQTFAKYDESRLARFVLLCERTNRQSVAQRNGGGETVYVRRGLSAKALAVHIMRPRPRNTIAVDRVGRRPTQHLALYHYLII